MCIRDSLYGAVDENGDLVIAPKFESLRSWVGEYGIARQGDYSTGKRGLVNRDGELLAGRYFEKVERPNQAFTVTEDVYLPRVKSEGVWYSITKDGKLIDDQKATVEIETGPLLTCDDFSINRTLKGLTAIDKYENVIAEFDDQGYLSFFIEPHTSSTNESHRCNAPIDISSNGKSGFILPEGRLFADQLFENYIAIFEDVLAYSEDKKWGPVSYTHLTLPTTPYV